MHLRTTVVLIVQAGKASLSFVFSTAGPLTAQTMYSSNQLQSIHGSISPIADRVHVKEFENQGEALKLRPDLIKGPIFSPFGIYSGGKNNNELSLSNKQKKLKEKNVTLARAHPLIFFCVQPLEKNVWALVWIYTESGCNE